jgi:hypothetical protein
MRIKDNITNKTSCKFNGLLVTNLKGRRDHVNPSKTKSLHKHFGEKCSQQLRERWRKTSPWLGVLKLSRRRKKRLGFHATARILLGPAILLNHYQVKP